MCEAITKTYIKSSFSILKFWCENTQIMKPTSTTLRFYHHMDGLPFGGSGGNKEILKVFSLNSAIANLIVS